MRKFYLLFAALFACTLVANAGVKNLFKQDFEIASTPQDAGWTSPNLANGMSIYSDMEGRLFQFDLGANNNRNAVIARLTVWVTSIRAAARSFTPHA